MASDSTQTIIPPSVLLSGASSQVGVFLVPRLLEAGYHVSAVNRTGRPAWFPEFERVTWVPAAEAVSAAQHCDFLISAGPMQLARKLLQNAGKLQSAVVFSSSSVESKQQSGNLQEKKQMQEMLELESSLLDIAGRAGIRMTIFRPTLIYGCGLDTNISRLARWIERFGTMPINGKGGGLRQPVHAEDLAEAALAALQCDEVLPATMTMPGGETLSYSSMVSRIFEALGLPVRLIRLPEWLFTSLVRIANILRIGRDINSEMVRRQNTNLVFENTSATESLNFKPRPFRPGKADFALPDFYLKSHPGSES